jgi:hypothetical protein
MDGGRAVTDRGFIPAPCESEFEGKAIFVLGTARSGTTWLAEQLRAHPAVAGVQSESLIFESMTMLWNNAHRADGQGLAAYLSQEEITVAFRRYCDQFFAASRDRHAPGATWVIEKTPSHTRRIPMMARIYPDAWYVHIVRDGRDVARSLILAPIGTSDPAMAGGSWVMAERDVQMHSWRLGRLRHVRYEELLRDPLDHITSLLEWMDLRVDRAVVDAIEESSTTEVMRFGSSEAISAGKWRSMDPADLAIVEIVQHDLLAELGYLEDPRAHGNTPS